MIPAPANDNGTGAQAPLLPSLRPVGCPAGIDPADWRAAIAHRIEALQDRMEALLSALDRMDGDPDLEPDADDEPLSVALVPTVHGYRYAGTDLEADDGI